MRKTSGEDRFMLNLMEVVVVANAIYQFTQVLAFRLSPFLLDFMIWLGWSVIALAIVATLKEKIREKERE